MEFSLPEELEILRKMVSDFAAEKIAPGLAGGHDHH
jgi:hypothetical protein